MDVIIGDQKIPHWSHWIEEENRVLKELLEIAVATIEANIRSERKLNVSPIVSGVYSGTIEAQEEIVKFIREKLNANSK